MRSARYGTAYGDLNVVYNDQASSFMRECSALMKQAGSFMSMATLGRTVNKTGVGDFLSSKVEAAVDTGKRRAVNIVESVLGDTKEKILNNITNDRDMPGGVRKIFQTVLGVYFSDVQQEVLDELAKRLKTLSYTDTKKKKKKKDIKTTLLNIGINRTFYDYFTWKFLRKKLNDTRAWLLYNELPYDKTFWGKVRSPGWWLILITKLYSGWGIQAVLYAFRLYMIDRTDEWQLFEYISNFKGIQFLTGVIAMFQGVLTFMECAGLVGKGEPHTCHTNGPGMDALAVCDGSVGNVTCATFIGAGFFARILLTWYAFYLMRRSFSFGKPIFNDSRLVGAIIEIHEIRKGMKSNLLASIIKACVGCGRDAKTLARHSMRAALGHEPTPLERFREAVRLTVEEIKRNDPWWISKNEGHYTVYIKAKVVAYSVKSGLHTICHVYGENASQEQEEVDLQKKLFTVVTLKQLQPRRLQTLIWYYDLWVFIIVVAVSVRSVTMMNLKRDDWQLFLLLYWVQCFYSVLSFPFICLVIPGVQSIICHAKQTGYDESGVLQARIKRESFANGEEEPVPRSKIFTACYPLYRGAKGVQL